VEQDQHADLIDLLLASDEPTRRQILLQSVESGALSRSEADEVMARAVRLERLAGPHLAAQTPAPKPTAWGIDYP
jgi:hypothetical protein